jgi:hypothetical protein
MRGGVYFTATQCVPTFVQEIVDLRAVELETVTFECQFSGTPTPGNFYISLNLFIIIFTVVHHPPPPPPPPNHHCQTLSESG